MQYNELLEKQIIGRLRLDNPWWTEKEIAPFTLKCTLVYTLIFFIHWWKRQI